MQWNQEPAIALINWRYLQDLGRTIPFRFRVFSKTLDKLKQFEECFYFCNGNVEPVVVRSVRLLDMQMKSHAAIIPSTILPSSSDFSTAHFQIIF